MIDEQLNKLEVTGFFATIKVLIRADSEAEACDVMSETLRQPNAFEEGGVVDWTYLREGDPLTPVVECKPSGTHLHSPYECPISLPYDEGSAFEHEKT